MSKRGGYFMKLSFFKTSALFLSFCICSTLIAQEQNTITADRALNLLLKGNQRYVNDTPINRENQLSQRREAIAPAQHPIAVVVGCSDSRVPPEMVFDQGLGDLFVVRVAGNVVSSVEMDSVEFAAAFLHTPLIVVLGHEACGAVRAVLEGKVIDEDIVHIAPLIQPAVDLSKGQKGDRLTNAIKENVRLVVEKLKANPIMAPLVQKGTLKIVGGYYELESGNVLLLNEDAQ